MSELQDGGAEVGSGGDRTRSEEYDVRPFLFRVIYTINQFLTFYYIKERFVLFE